MNRMWKLERDKKAIIIAVLLLFLFLFGYDGQDMREIIVIQTGRMIVCI